MSAPIVSLPDRDTIAALLPQGAFSIEPALCDRAAEDIFAREDGVVGIFTPAQVGDVAPALARLSAQGLTVAPRGGGLSYTKGYLPSGDRLLIDLSGLDAIERIDPDNMTILVQAGCTWKQLHEALSPLGLRVGSWGPLSGVKATIGGSVSQNAAFWGAGLHASVAESVLGVEVALGTGETLRTGALAHGSDTPFFRYYGPDLTGLFIGDCGALGIKTRILLRLIPRPTDSEARSFSFASADAMLGALGEIARGGLGAQQFGFDPTLIALRSRKQGVMQDIQALSALFRSGSSLKRKVSDAFSVVRAGRSFLDDIGYNLHLMVEGDDAQAMRGRLNRIERIVSARGGKPVENTVPTMMQATPFGSLAGIFGPEGERWAPLHVLVPIAQASDAFDDIIDTLGHHSQAMQQHGIAAGTLFSSIGTTTALVEVMLFWPEAIGPLHRHLAGEKLLARLKSFPENPEARAAINAIRADLLDCFARRSSAHMQIGRTYPWMERQDPVQIRLLESLRAMVDPANIMNSGVLGLRGVAQV